MADLRIPLKRVKDYQPESTEEHIRPIPDFTINQIHAAGDPPPNPNYGDLYFDTTNYTHYLFDGGQWIEIC